MSGYLSRLARRTLGHAPQLRSTAASFAPMVVPDLVAPWSLAPSWQGMVDGAQAAPAAAPGAEPLRAGSERPAPPMHATAETRFTAGVADSTEAQRAAPTTGDRGPSRHAGPDQPPVPLPGEPPPAPAAPAHAPQRVVSHALPTIVSRNTIEPIPALVRERASRYAPPAQSPALVPGRSAMPLAWRPAQDGVRAQAASAPAGRPPSLTPALAPDRSARSGEHSRNSASEPLTVQVTIGRIEIAAVHSQTPAPRAAPPGARPLSLDDYLARQGRR